MNKLFRSPLHPIMVLPRLLVLAALAAGCTPAPDLVPTPTAGPATPTPFPAGDVKVWLTSVDQTHLLEPQPDLFFGQAGEAAQAIYVNENNRYQQMDGFGASMTDSSAWLIYTQLSTAQRDGLMSAMFSPTDGIGISSMRIPMGASDFVHGEAYTYDDMPPGEVDPELKNFSIEHDRAYIIPALQDALKLNPKLKIIASPWSPPAWMKTSDALGKGELKPEYYGALANYFVKFIQAYEAENIPIDAITLQNEPHYEPGSYPGMRMEPEDQAEFIKNHLGPAFEARGIATKILIWDHNWNEWKYPIAVLDDEQAKDFISGSAFHCYAGVVIGQSLVHDAHPDRDIYFTECSGGAWIPSYAEGFKRDMEELVIGATRNWARTVIMWNLALDTSSGPHNGGCSTCYGLVTIDPATESGFTFTYDYYPIAHASKFVVPGAYRIASSSPANQNPKSVAFENPDGSKVLIVSNLGSSDRSFAVSWGTKVFSYMLPAGSVATFTWNGTQENSSAPVPPPDMRTRVNAGKVFLNWGFSPLAETYTVKRSDQPGGPYAVLAEGLGIPEYADDQVAAGNTYYYVVSAVNALGESQNSNEDHATP